MEKKTSTGLQENIAALLSYLGWWITGIVFLLLEPDNKFVRFHAIQSILLFGFIMVAGGCLDSCLSLVAGSAGSSGVSVSRFGS